MTTPLFLLRCVQLGKALRDVHLRPIGKVIHLFAESGNDEVAKDGYKVLASQHDMDVF